VLAVSLVLIIGGTGPFGGVSEAAAESGIDRLEALASRLRSEPGWRASYVQEYVPAGMDLGDEERGAVTVGWPDKARFDAGDPTEREMGLEGRLVRLVDLEATTCDEHVLTDDEWQRMPLAAVLEPQRALDHFSVGALGEHGLVLTPYEPGGVARLELEVGADGLPLHLVLEDPQGAVNRLDFADWRATDGAPSGGWLPSPPSGMSCVSDEE